MAEQSSEHGSGQPHYKHPEPHPSPSGSPLDRFLRLDLAAPQPALVATLTDQSRPSFAFFFMLSMAATIATFGLLQNSTPAIIGAMIIAPLMEPIVGLSLGSLTGERRLLKLSAVSIVIGTTLVIAIAFVITKVSGLSVIGSEVLARTSPSTLDFGVALISGAAAAFAHTRLNIANSIAGVAIAVALVPPLASCGVSLAIGDAAVSAHGIALTTAEEANPGLAMAGGAFLLFATNIIGIVGLGTVMFAIQRYGHYRRPVFFALIVLASAAVIVPPLEKRYRVVYLEDQVLEVYSQTLSKHPHLFSGVGYIEHVDVTRRDDALVVTIRLFELREFIDKMVDAAKAFEEALSERTDTPLALRLQVVPAELRVYTTDPSIDTGVPPSLITNEREFR